MTRFNEIHPVIMLAVEKAGLSYTRCDEVPFNFTSKGLEVAVFTTYHVIILPYEIADGPRQQRS